LAGGGRSFTLREFIQSARRDLFLVFLAEALDPRLLSLLVPFLLRAGEQMFAIGRIGAARSDRHSPDDNGLRRREVRSLNFLARQRSPQERKSHVLV
jgi:hypothetical protein